MPPVNELMRRNWWNAEKGKANASVFPYVRAVENAQAPMMDKFEKLAATYDVNARTNRYTSADALARRLSGQQRAIMTENLIASNVDTVASNVATSDVRIRVQTDEADWSHQRMAKWLERYAEGLSQLLEVGPKCRTGFKAGGAVKGTGINKVWVDQFDQLQVSPVPVDNIIVDELEARDGKPRQMHYRDFFDREDMMGQYPDFAERIARAQMAGGTWRTWAGYRPIEVNQIVVVESWRLPVGPRGHKNYRPGRHVICIDGADLLDEEWHKPHFPFAIMRWNAPIWGFYGISLAERILPHQNMLNRRNYQINRSLDRKADPVTYVNKADQHLAAKSVAQIGAVAVYNAAIPVTVDHQAVGKETYDSRREIKSDARDEAGVSDDMATGSVPTGIETGAGVRESRQTHTRRFSAQEQAFEQFWLDTVWLMLDCCKDLGKSAPSILHVSKYGSTKIKWSEVDMGDLRIQLAAASTTPDTQAGRQQRVVELAQAGVITLDESRELIDHPDIDAKLSLYNAVSEAVEYSIESILDGRYVQPTPYMNLQACVAMGQRTYNKIAIPEENGGAPEEILEYLAAFIDTAANMLNPPAPAMPIGAETMPGVAPATGGPMTMDNASAGAFAPNAYAPMTA